MELLILFGFGNRLLIVILIIVIIFGSFAGLNIASIVEYQIQLAFGLCICGKFWFALNLVHCLVDYSEHFKSVLGCSI